MTTTIKNTIEEIREYFDNLNFDEKVYAHNIYCQNFNYPDDEIYSNDEEFFNTFFEGRPMEAARSVVYGDYSYCHDYVMFDGYGNLQSINKCNIENHIDIDAICNDILENPDRYDIELEDEEEE